MKLELIALLQSDENFSNDFRYRSLELLLLNKEVLKFTIVPDAPYEDRTWQALVSQCPRLEQLYYQRPYDPLAHVGHILGRLTQMEKLSVIQLDLAFDDDSLCILAMSLPKLR